MLKIIIRYLHQCNSSIKVSAARTMPISSKQQLLQQIAAANHLELGPSILLSDEDTPKPRLTRLSKQQLGLFIPPSPFPHRMTKQQQKHYLPTLTKQLYLRQQQQLTTHLKILQNNLLLKSSRVTLDSYINLLYKDIYARYLVSKGVGVEWNGFYSDLGVLNSHDTSSFQNQPPETHNYSLLLDFIQNHASQLQKATTIGMYDYESKRFVHPSEMQVQKIKKMGYYIKKELTEFGSFREEFSSLQQTESKVYLLIFVEKLEKLINPNGVVICPDQKFYILKKYVQTEALETEYLMLSKEVYNRHQKYFRDSGYEKHSIFNSKYLLNMKAGGLPIIDEIGDYERESAAYLLNSSCDLADFERATENNLKHPENAIDGDGQVWIDGHNTNIFISNIKSTKQLEQLLQQKGHNFLDLYDIFEDEIYYEATNKHLLKFRLAQKYQIMLPPNASQLIMEGLKKEGTIISESKIVIPRGVIGKKPRERRAFRKEKKQMIKQITEHYSIAQSLDTINNITLSSLSSSQFQAYIFTKGDRVIAYEQILTQEQLSRFVERGQLSEELVRRIEEEGYTVERININDTLASSLLYLNNLSTSKQILNILIEPQSQTEQLIPFALHLNYLINRGKSRRRIQKLVKSNIKLIKLHPTLSPQHQKLDVMTIIRGVIKSNHKEQYGFGYQAMRLWCAKNDNFLGDRTVSETEVSLELKHGQSIRRTFWELASLLPERIQTVTPQLYISRFMLDCIDSFIFHLDECYKHLDINKAYALTVDFFRNIVHEIYAKSIRKRIIAYPNREQNKEHFYVIRRIMELIGAISPLLPFTAFHISKTHLPWPQILNPKFYESLRLHNEMIRLRVKVVNKLRLNRLDHAQLYLQTLKEEFNERDLQLFLDLDKVTVKKPAEYQRQCSLQLSKNNCVSLESKLIFYINEDHCIRCDSNSTQTKHLCSSCLDYLQEEVGQPYRFYPKGGLRSLNTV